MLVDYKNMKTISNYFKYVKISTIVFAAVVALSVRELTARVKGIVFESQPRQTLIVKQVMTAALPNTGLQEWCHGSADTTFINGFIVSQ